MVSKSSVKILKLIKCVELMENYLNDILEEVNLIRREIVRLNMEKKIYLEDISVREKELSFTDINSDVNSDINIDVNSDVNIDVNIDVRCVSLPKLTRKVTNACPPRKLTKKKKRIVWNNFVVDTSDSSESDMD